MLCVFRRRGRSPDLPELSDAIHSRADEGIGPYGFDKGEGN